MTVKDFFTSTVFTFNAFSLIQPYLDFYLMIKDQKDQNSPSGKQQYKEHQSSMAYLVSGLEILSLSETALGFPNWVVGMLDISWMASPSDICTFIYTI